MTPTPSTDEQHLRLLAIFHYVLGGMGVLFACLPLIHVAFGIAMLNAPQSFGDQPSQQPPPAVGWMFAGIGAIFFLIGQLLSFCILIAGRFLQRRVRYNAVFVMACIECILMPFGTVLGVFTIIVLSRPSVKDLFDRSGG
jgi:hypothetical protein